MAKTVTTQKGNVWSRNATVKNGKKVMAWQKDAKASAETTKKVKRQTGKRQGH